jgi:hypothetical protein
MKGQEQNGRLYDGFEKRWSILKGITKNAMDPDRKATK